jgi:arsenate reductase
MSDKQRVLILCTGNSARSQMAEGWLRAHAGDRYEVFSAGSMPTGRVHPGAVAAMREIGIDIGGHTSKSMMQFVGQPRRSVPGLPRRRQALPPRFHRSRRGAGV